MNGPQKAFLPGDLSKAATASTALVVCAASSREANHDAAQEAKDLGIPVSVADQKDEGSFYFPSIVAGAGVVGGFISAQGKDHSAVREAAARVRRFLNDET